MNEEQQLRLQAFLDGELPEREAREVAAWVARDRDATALLAELRNTRQVLAQSDPALKLTESREFYWSGIEREIQRRERVPQTAPVAASIHGLLRRLLAPVVTLAVLLLVGIGGLRLGLWKAASPGPETEMTLADASAFTYQDFANGTTLVWVSYPAESGFAKNQGH